MAIHVITNRRLKRDRRGEDRRKGDRRQGSRRRGEKTTRATLKLKLLRYITEMEQLLAALKQEQQVYLERRKKGQLKGQQIGIQERNLALDVGLSPTLPAGDLKILWHHYRYGYLNPLKIYEPTHPHLSKTC